MLKKLALVVAIILIVKVFPINQTIFKSDIGEYSFYLGSSSSNCQIVTVTAGEAQTLKKRLKSVCGESLKTNNVEIIESEVERLGGILVFEENVSGIAIKYYYSDKISNYKTINGKKVNLQTAFNSNIYTIGSPLIFGSF